MTEIKYYERGKKSGDKYSSVKPVSKFKTNIFYYYASEYMEKATSDAEIKNIDMTQEFWREIEHEIKNDELIDINVNVKVRMGKSTLGIDLGKKIDDLLRKYKKKVDDIPFGMRNIARDQQEYSKIMRNPKTQYTVIVTDEINELEQTGENVTHEQALSKVFSNVQAGRYVHRVSCSPKEVADPNADIFLEIVSLDRRSGITHAHLYYKMFKGGNEYMQLLGYVNFDVSGLIHNWEKHVKKHFLKNKRTKHDEAIISEWRKKDYYVEYTVKKYEKMDLLIKEGILRPRELEYADVILEVVERLRSLMRFNIITRDNIRSNVNIGYKKRKMPISIVGEEMTTQKISSILNYWKGYFSISKIIKESEEKEKLDKETISRLKEEQAKMMETANEEMQYWERLKELNKLYNEHYLIE